VELRCDAAESLQYEKAKINIHHRSSMIWVLGSVVDAANSGTTEYELEGISFLAATTNQGEQGCSVRAYFTRMTPSGENKGETS
jgi:hypothetical protein